MLTQTVKRTLSDDVVNSIRNAILVGRLSPGERLGEEALAESLGVSRGPVREAFRQLEREGLIVQHRNGRAYVARLSREDLEEIYPLRTALEMLAVQLAVRNATPEVLNELQQILDTVSSSPEIMLTEQEAAEFDINFHDTLCRAAGNKRLYACWSDLRPQIHVFLLSRNVADGDFREYAVKSHRTILEAIRNKEEQRALALMQAHLQGSYQRLVRTYDTK